MQTGLASDLQESPHPPLHLPSASWLPGHKSWNMTAYFRALITERTQKSWDEKVWNIYGEHSLLLGIERNYSLIQELIPNILKCQHRKEFKSKQKALFPYRHSLVEHVTPSNNSSKPSQGKELLLWDLPTKEGPWAMPEPSSCCAAERGGSASWPETCAFLSQQWNQARHNKTQNLLDTEGQKHTTRISTASHGGSRDVSTYHPALGRRDSRFSVDGIAWKSVRGLSLQDGGLESLLFFLERCSWALVRGTSGTVLNICIAGWQKGYTFLLARKKAQAWIMTRSLVVS